MSYETISVIGLGYIGLPTAAMFASRKKNVIGVDINQETVDVVNRGEIHIVEPNLDAIVKTAVTERYLRAVTIPEEADAFLIAVPTPFTKNNTSTLEPDLSYVKDAINSIAPLLKKGNLVILESTSPVGTTEKIAEWLSLLRTDLTFPHKHGEYADVNIAHCPERVLPGNVVSELVQNDRVIGGISFKCSNKAIDLYKTFVKGECVITNSRTAEMAKLTENSCRDVQIAFANELSIICDELDINVWELISIANRHPRINILSPGPGVGGHCIAVDPWFIISAAKKNSKLITTARNVNISKEEWVIEKIKKSIKENNISKIACYGLSFKPDIDDFRESPALRISNFLNKAYPNKIFAVEPNIINNELNGIKIVDHVEALNNCDLCVILVNHKEFIDYDFSKFKCVIDTIGII